MIIITNLLGINFWWECFYQIVFGKWIKDIFLPLFFLFSISTTATFKRYFKTPLIILSPCFFSIPFYFHLYVNASISIFLQYTVPRYYKVIHAWQENYFFSSLSRKRKRERERQRDREREGGREGERKKKLYMNT